MPRLSRLRFVSIGHPNARFDDLVLDFRDAEGQATDSTLWLRNGGGKSSILNLFFSGVRPNRREFLGTAAETKRKLREYVQADDHAVIVYEWELDGQPGQLTFDGRPDSFITGTFYEWRGTELKRFYFACRVVADEPQLTLQGLPLYRTEQEKQVRRFTLNGFKQAWQDLQKQHPSRHIIATEIQNEWKTVLDDAGIDPELFAYQIKMNLREGSADELFRFDSHDAFIDFLLELVLDPSLGDTVRKNIETHRDDIRRSKHRLRPEQGLVEGLISRLSPMQEVTSERQALRDTANDCRRRLGALSLFGTGRIRHLQQVASEQIKIYDHMVQLAVEAEEKSREHRQHSATLRFFAAEMRSLQAKSEHEANQSRLEKASRQVKLWEAAIPLRNALRFERNATEHRGAVQQARSEHQPLYDSLSTTADRYAAALHASINQLKENESTTIALMSTLRQQVANARMLAGQCDVEISGLKSEISHLETQQKEQQERYAKLVSEGILLRTETGVDAVERINHLIEKRRQEVEKLTARIADRRAHREQLRNQRQSAEIIVSREIERLREAQTKYEDASALREQLESNDTLRQTLEVEDIDLEGLTEASFALVKQKSNAFVDRIVSLRVATLEDERAIHHLKNGGFLPPTRDVECLLAVLTPRIRAWSGWVYISENATDYRVAIQQTPELALGVIVADQDLEKARSIIQKSTLQLETPVVLAPQSAFVEEKATTCAVFGPSSDAHFDRSAGQKELIRRDAQWVEHEEHIKDAKVTHKELTDLDTRLRAFCANFPRGWFSEQQARIDRHRMERDASSALAAKLGTEIETTDGEIKTAEDGLEVARRSFLQYERNVEVAKEFVERHENKEKSRREALAEAKQTLSEQEDQRQKYLADATAKEEQLEEKDGHLKDMRYEIAQSELLFEQIEYRSDPQVDSKSGPVQQLRDDYLRLKAQYEEKVGEEGLLLAARENDENARRERRKLQGYLDDGVSEEHVNEALDQLDDPEYAEQSKDEAHREKTAAFSATGTSAQSLERFERKLEEARRSCQELSASETIAEAEQTLDAEAAEHAADDSQLQADMLDETAGKSFSEAEGAEAKKLEAEKSVEFVGSCQDQVESLARSYSDVLTRLSLETAPIEETLGLNDGELRTQIKQLNGDLETLKECDFQLNARRLKITREVRQWVSDQQFDQLQSQIVRQFRNAEEILFEEQSAYFLEQLTLRRRTIQEKLAEIDQNRDQLVSELQAVAEDGHNVLRSTANQSRLPDCVPGLAGSHFLTINMKWPDDPAEQRGRLAELVDELVDCKEMPTGIELIQSAVRRLARPIRVRVLNPDPNLNGQRLDIPDLAKFSGGERVTCAVLLYCTLAQLRARRRGLSHKPSGVLLLDNPIGSASRVSFINIQRDVARAMGVQLIYTTGVNDYEALRPLPNLIRLRNDRVNRNNGQHVVEHESNGQPIEATRVVRRENVPVIDAGDC